MKSLYIILFVLLTFTGYSYGQESDTLSPNATKKANFLNTNMDYQVRAYFSIGGSSPLGFPKEIRSIEHYNPKLQLGLQVNATKWLHDEQNWGIRVGIAVDGKGMGTKAEVKNYYTEIIQDNSKVRGYYTGLVQTDVRNTYVTIPVSAVYNLSSQWNLYGGLYFSLLIDQEFDGYVSEGYLRQGDPTGQKITFEDGSRAPFDFSSEVQKFQWGAQIGAEWNLNEHFKLFPELTYGINGLLDNDFKALSFSLHNIYLNLGFGYQF